jgi:hypothetical protein
MRYAQYIRYLVRVWADIAPLPVPWAELQRLQNAIGRNDLVPAVATEGTVVRSALITANGGLQVVLPGESIDVQLLPTTDRPNLGTLEDFVAEASRIVAAFVDLFPERLARRIALVREGLLDVAPADMDNLAERVLRIPQAFQHNRPFEWDWRIGSRLEHELGGIRQAVNTIATLKRANVALTHGGVAPTPSDRIRLDLDINSAHDEQRPRFRRADVQAFLAECLAWQRELWGNIEQLID